MGSRETVTGTAPPHHVNFSAEFFATSVSFACSRTWQSWSHAASWLWGLASSAQLSVGGVPRGVPGAAVGAFLWPRIKADFACSKGVASGRVGSSPQKNTPRGVLGVTQTGAGGGGGLPPPPEAVVLLCGVSSGRSLRQLTFRTRRCRRLSEEPLLLPRTANCSLSPPVPFPSLSLRLCVSLSLSLSLSLLIFLLRAP